MGYTSNLSFVRKNPITSAVVTVTLAAGVIYTLVAADNSGAVVRQIKTQDGRSVLTQTGSGAQTGSGNLKVADQKTGSGAIQVGGSDGGRVCVADIDGTGCSCISANDGTIQSWVGIGAECP